MSDDEALDAIERRCEGMPEVQALYDLRGLAATQAARIRELTDELEAGWRVLGEAQCPATDFIANSIETLVERALSAEQRLEKVEKDAARFVFEHTHPDEMIDIEMEALSGAPKDIDWWRAAIDKALSQEAI